MGRPWTIFKTKYNIAFSRIKDSYYVENNNPAGAKGGLSLSQILSAVNNVTTGNIGGLANDLDVGTVLSGNGVSLV